MPEAYAAQRENDRAALDEAEGGAPHLQDLAADDGGEAVPSSMSAPVHPQAMSGSSTVTKPSRCRHSRTSGVVANNSPRSL
jgi:hypothetical protein